MRTQPTHGSATGENAALPQQRVREEEGGAFPYVIIRNARVQSICKSQSCMVSKTDREEEGEGGGRSRGTREKLLRAALQLAASAGSFQHINAVAATFHKIKRTFKPRIER